MDHAVEARKAGGAVPTTLALGRKSLWKAFPIPASGCLGAGAYACIDMCQPEVCYIYIPASIQANRQTMDMFAPACLPANLPIHAYMHTCLHTDTQTYRYILTGRQAGRQAGRQTDKHACKHIIYV